MTILTEAHIKEAMSVSILIASSCTAKPKSSKKFLFNVWENEYSIWQNGKYLCGGQAIEELLNIYNELE